MKWYEMTYIYVEKSINLPVSIVLFHKRQGVFHPTATKSLWHGRYGTALYLVTFWPIYLLLYVCWVPTVLSAVITSDQLSAQTVAIYHVTPLPHPRAKIAICTGNLVIGKFLPMYSQYKLIARAQGWDMRCVSLFEIYWSFVITTQYIILNFTGRLYKK